MNTQEHCPICGKGPLSNHADPLESDYKGQKKMLALHYRVCAACHADFAGARESRLNKRGVMAFRKTVDGLLTGAEICAIRQQYQLTQSQAARLFGGGPVAFSKYENDDVAQSEPMDKLLRLVRRSEAAFWELVAECGATEEFSRATLITASSASSNVVLLQAYRGDSARGPTTVTLRPYAQGEKTWK